MSWGGEVNAWWWAMLRSMDQRGMWAQETCPREVDIREEITLHPPELLLSPRWDHPTTFSRDNA